MSRLPRGRLRRLSALLTAALVGAVAGCGTSITGTATSASSAVNPNQRETLPPGDIPDTIAFVPYALPGAGIAVSTPEGWSRSGTGRGVKFTDKLNEIELFTLPTSPPLTVASVRSSEVRKLAATVKGFRLQSVTTVARPAGPAVRIAYLGDSRPDPVTGKVGALAFERYDFSHGGREVVLVLSSPNGSDNVDPWRKVTSSLRYTR